MSTAREGDVIGGQYRLLARLGGGGSGTVYRAAPITGGREVALKLVDPRITRQEAMRTRFEREARALNGLDHPHLIHLLDFGVHDGAPFLVTELLRGEPLDRLLAKRPLPSGMAFEIGLGIVAGLAHAHAHGVLHRDLKPSNVFIAVLEGGALHPKLLDFGLARFVDPSRWGKHTTLTEEGAILGTPTYMAPEQGFGGAADARSDVYSAGVVLYELITYRPPFVSENRATLLRAHALDPVPPLAEVRRDLAVQPALEALIAKALAKEPKDRFDDAGALLHAMQEVPEPPTQLRR